MMDVLNLSTDFKDDILTDTEGKRKFQMIQNSDGTVSFEDVTEYSQVGSTFGAKEVNEIRKAINDLITEVNKKQNQITSGPAEPSGGEDGDVYIKLES